MSTTVELTLLGVGAMNSPRFAPCRPTADIRPSRIAFDGGPGAEPPRQLDAWLVTDERSELRTALQRLAADRGL